MWGGELFVPRIPSYRILDVAEAIAPGMKLKFVGIRPGEKIHEEMITVTDAMSTIRFDDYFVIQPIQSFWGNKIGILGGVSCSDGFKYASNCNCENLSKEELIKLLKDFLPVSS